MSNILVYALHNEGTFNKNSLGAISEASRLAGELGGEAHAVVVGQARRGHLVPGRAPEQDRGPELVARRGRREVAVAQALHVERQVGHGPQVRIRRDRRLRGIAHSAASAAEEALGT